MFILKIKTAPEFLVLNVEKKPDCLFII